MAEGKYQVCPQCDGEGSMVHRALSVWTAEDRAEDPDGFAEMMEGRYDVTCDMCNGLRVVTRESLEDFDERREDYLLRLRESGIYPGNPDYY